MTRRLEGKAYLYRAKTPRRKAMQERVRELVELYCRGSVRSLLLNLAESEELSEEDIEALKALQARKKSSEERVTDAQ